MSNSTDAIFYRNANRTRVAVSLDDGDTVFLPDGRRATLDAKVWTASDDVDPSEIAPTAMAVISAAIIAGNDAAITRTNARETAAAGRALAAANAEAAKLARREARLAWECSPEGKAHQARMNAFYRAVISACRA